MKKSLGVPPQLFTASVVALASCLHFGEFVGVHEAMSQCHLKYGRLEGRRPLNAALARFARAYSPVFSAPGAWKASPKGELRQLLMQAMAESIAFSAKCKEGHGMDFARVLLDEEAAQNGVRPELFENPVYAKLSDIKVKVSSLPPVEGISFGTKPPSGGYNVGFAVHATSINVVIM